MSKKNSPEGKILFFILVFILVLVLFDFSAKGFLGAGGVVVSIQSFIKIFI